MKIVKVTWIDPTIDAGWVENDHESPLNHLVTYGILISKTKKQICVAGTYDPSDKKYADRTRFPTGCVKKIEVICENE